MGVGESRPAGPRPIAGGGGDVPDRGGTVLHWELHAGVDGVVDRGVGPQGRVAEGGRKA